MLIPFLYAEQLCAELRRRAVVQHAYLLDFADCTRDALSAGGHFCASGFRAKTSFQSCLSMVDTCALNAFVWAFSFDHSCVVNYAQLGQYALEVAEGNVLEQPYASC